MTFEMSAIIESKRQLSLQQAALPIAEKLRILDLLRERTLSIQSATKPANTVAPDRHPSNQDRA